MKKLWKKFATREVIAYLIAGVLTTLVNMAGFYLLRRFVPAMELLWANAAAYMLSVLFAYVVNSKYVFVQEKQGVLEELSQMAKFFGARIVSLLLDQAGMWLLAEYLGVQEMLAKIAVNGMVIILNYIFSKWFVFRRK